MAKTTRAAIGWSANPDALMAGQAAARMAYRHVGQHAEARLVIVFGSSRFDQAMLLQGVRDTFGDSVPLVGGSTAGELTPEGPKHHSCVVMAVASEELLVGVGVSTQVEANARRAGYEAAQEAVRALPSKSRSGMILFGDGLLTGYHEVLWGIQEVLGTSALVTGGLMGDDLRFTQTYQYAQERVISRGIVGLLLGGNCAIGVGVEHGFEPISKPRRVTRAHANILHELDGRPAAAFYEEYFGEALAETMREAGLTRELIAYPLGMQMDSSGRFLLRSVRGFGPDGSLRCTGEIPEGARVQLMIGSKSSAVEAAVLAARQAVQSLRAVHFAVVFDSAVRQRLLGHEAEEELLQIRQVIGPSVPLIGCYTYGEQAPLGHPYPYGRSSVQTGACLVIAVGLS